LRFEIQDSWSLSRLASAGFELGPPLSCLGGYGGPLGGVVVVEHGLGVGAQHPQARDAAEGAGVLLLALVPGELAAGLQQQPLEPALRPTGVGPPVELEAALGREGRPQRVEVVAPAVGGGDGEPRPGDGLERQPGRPLHGVLDPGELVEEHRRPAAAAAGVGRGGLAGDLGAGVEVEEAQVGARCRLCSAPEEAA
jgi:hypothetical protein